MLVAVRSVDAGDDQIDVPINAPLGERAEFLERCAPKVSVLVGVIDTHLSRALVAVLKSGKRRRVVLEVLP